MIDLNRFREAVLDAYENLYNIPHLENNSLLDLLLELPRSQEGARRLKRLLIAAVDNLDPGDDAPVSSREWRLHRLLTMRYIDGASAQQIADQLAISLRHYYREQKDALELLVDLLWHRIETGEGLTDVQSASRGELLRNEAELLGKPSTGVNLNSTFDGVWKLIQPILLQKSVRLRFDLPETLPLFQLSPTLLRQLLIEILNLVTHISGPQTTIAVSTVKASDKMILLIEVSRFQASIAEDRLETVRNLAELMNIQLQIGGDPQHIQLKLWLPIHNPRTILLVDDNDEVAQLLTRYLSKHGYQIIRATSGHEAIRLTRELQPYAIVLDVMIPEPDGWAVLQTLHNHHETYHIPIIVSTVLSASELALALGAAAFLNKPIAEADLIATLDGIESASVS